MLKKALIMGLAATMALSMAACGSPKKQEASLTKDAETQNVQAQNMQDENIQNEAVRPDDAENIPEDNDTDYEICLIYFNYRTDILSEEEAEEQLQDFGVTLDEAAEIFNHYDGEAAEDIAMMRSSIPMHFEPTEEIMNASMHQLKFQVADMVFTSFSRVTDCMEQLENSEMPFVYEYNPDQLIPCSSFSDIKIFLNGELYMKLYVTNPKRSEGDKETRTLKECIANRIELFDYSNVYYAGGIPALNSGISSAEYDERMQNDLQLFIENNKVERKESIVDNRYCISYNFLYTSKEQYVLECDGIHQAYDSYNYYAAFNETGTKLESLQLILDPSHSGYLPNNNSFTTYIVIER